MIWAIIVGVVLVSMFAIALYQEIKSDIEINKDILDFQEKQAKGKEFD